MKIKEFIPTDERKVGVYDSEEWMKKLNFGCGKNIQKGWDNADVQGEAKLSFDFEKYPYPMKENTYDYILCKCILEHMNEPDKVLLELRRICKKNGIISIIVPYYNNKSSYSSLNHKHHFSDTAFITFVEEFDNIKEERKFKIVYSELVPTSYGKWIYPKWFRNKLGQVIGGVLSAIHIKLMVVKGK